MSEGVVSATPLVASRRSEHVREIALDNPPVNALSWEALRQLRREAEIAAADDSAHVVILTGTGARAFCAGADFKEAAGFSESQREQRLEDLVQSFAAVQGIPVPVICALTGPVAGGGLLLAALCDYRIAVVSATVSMPEIDRRTVAAGPILRRLGCSEGALRRLLYTGARIDAETACRIGLLDELVLDRDALARAAGALADQLAAKPRAALVSTKRLLEERPRGSVDDWQATFLHAHRLAATVRASDRRD